VAARAEDLFADHRRSFRQPGPDSGLDPSAVGEFSRHAGHAASRHHGRAFLHGFSVIVEHFLAVLPADERADAGLRILRAAGFQALGLALERFHKPLEERPLDVDTLGAQTHLAAVGERGACDTLDRGIEIAVSKHDSGILAAEFKRDGTGAGGCCLHDRSAGSRLPGKCDRVDVGVACEVFAGRAGPETMNHVVDAHGHANGIHHLAKQGRSARRLFGRLHDNRVSGRRAPARPSKS